MAAGLLGGAGGARLCAVLEDEAGSRGGAWDRSRAQHAKLSAPREASGAPGAPWAAAAPSAAAKPEPDWRTFRGAAQRRSPSARRVVRRNPEKETSFCSCSLGLHGIFCFARVFLQDLLACEGGIPSSRRKLRVFGIRLGGCGVSDPRAVSDRARLSFGCRGSGPVCKKHCQA